MSSYLTRHKACLFEARLSEMLALSGREVTGAVVHDISTVTYMRWLNAESVGIMICSRSAQKELAPLASKEADNRET